MDNNIKEERENDNLESWKNWIISFSKEHGNCFDWLLQIFGISRHAYEGRINDIKTAIENPQTFFETFYEVYKVLVDLQEKNRILKSNNSSFGGNNSSLKRENENLKNEVYRLEHENRSIAQLQTRIQELEGKNEELERKNQELQTRVSSLMGQLGARDRDKSNTITSNDSRRQRDVLTREFIQLNNQDFTSASNQVFSHLCQANPTLRDNRKREIARIKSIFSNRIIKEGSELSIGNNSQKQQDDLSQAIKSLTDLLLNDLNMEARTLCPEPIIEALEKLVGKGLKLAKEIVNDDPPGEFSIANQGEDFNPEVHEPVPACQPSGKILYTTYPGYCLDKRILGDALKVYVFTVSEKEYESIKTTSTTESKEGASENDSANPDSGEQNKQADASSDNSEPKTENPSSVIEKLDALEKAGFSDIDIAKRVGIRSSQTVYNWKTGKQKPKDENVEKIDALYKEVCGGDCTQ